MHSIYYITGNSSKFANAEAFLSEQDIVIQQQKIPLAEIQSDSAEEIALQKAKDAYATINKPLFINDASWHIPALGGFPGPYMRYILDWLTIDDFLILMRDKQDRTIILRDTIVYKDELGEKVFTNDVVGQLLVEPTKGHGPYITRLVTFSGDGQSLAELNLTGFSEQEAIIWNHFSMWLKLK